MPAHLLLSAIAWDPFIRGILIVIVAVLVLPGSVYLVLAPHTGVRVGFSLAAAGLSGWMGLMGVIWAATGSSADVGRPASWKTVEVVTGDTKNATTVQFKQCATKSEKNCFRQLQAGDPELGDAQSSADKALASSAASAPQPGKEPTAAPTSRFQPPFSTPDQYIQVAVWRKDPATTWHIRKHKITPFGHDKHV